MPVNTEVFVKKLFLCDYFVYFQASEFLEHVDSSEVSIKVKYQILQVWILCQHFFCTGTLIHNLLDPHIFKFKNFLSTTPR